VGEERRAYSSEFKKEAVELTKTSGKKINQIAEDLGISATNLRRWCKDSEKHGNNCFPGHGNRITGTAEEEEIRRLRRELQIVTEERDILKKAVAIFSKTPK